MFTSDNLGSATTLTQLVNFITGSPGHDWLVLVIKNTSGVAAVATVDLVDDAGVIYPLVSENVPAGGTAMVCFGGAGGAKAPTTGVLLSAFPFIPNQIRLNLALANWTWGLLGGGIV